MKTEKEILDYLRENDADFDELYVPSEVNGLSVKNFSNMFYCIEVTLGDWKHSHAYLNYLMKKLGYDLIDEKLTDETGDDCYSSVHYFADSNLVKLFAA